MRIFARARLPLAATAILCLFGLWLYSQAPTTRYISTGGVDSNPCTQNQPCRTIVGARAKSQSGDTIQMAGGNYPSENITGTAQVTVGPMPGQSVSISSVTIPSSGIEIRDVAMPNGWWITPPNNRWVQASVPRNVTMRNIVAKSGYIVGEDINVIGGNYGGFDACVPGNQEDVIQLWQLPDANEVYHATLRVTIDGAVIHDITDHANECAGTPNAGRHVDCIQVLAGSFPTVRNSQFYNCATSDIILRPFRAPLNDILLENNFFQDVIKPGAAVNIGASGDVIGGNNVYRSNTNLGALAITCQPAGCFKVYGSISSTGSCSAGVTYDGNVWAQSWSATCGTLAKRGMPAFVGPTPSPAYMNGIQPNYLLAASDTVAIGAGSSISYPPFDIIGNPRPTTGRPDAGANQRTGAPPPPGPSITTTSLPAGVVGSPYNAVLAASGGTQPYTWSSTGLPAGLSLSAGAGAITGTPTAAGSFTPTFTVTGGGTASKPLPITITGVVPPPAPTITTTSLPAGIVGTPYNAVLAAAGGTPPYTWASTGLPAGLSLSASTGTITGTPAVTGIFSSIFTVTGGGTAAKPLPITITGVVPPPSFPAPGKRFTTKFAAPIRQTAPNNQYGPQIGNAPLGMTGVILVVTNARVPSTAAAVWVQVDPDDPSLPTGYIGSDNMTEITTPPPAPTLTVNCAAAKAGFTASNMPAGTNLTITGTAAGVTASCTTALP